MKSLTVNKCFLCEEIEYFVDNYNTLVLSDVNIDVCIFCCTFYSKENLVSQIKKKLFDNDMENILNEITSG